MLDTLAIANYRSLRDVKLALGKLTVITGPNGSGKSNLYRSLRLLSQTAAGTGPAALAREGGLQSVLWAGPETIARSVKQGRHPVQGTRRKKPISLKLGFTSDQFGYSIEYGLPIPRPDIPTEFKKDPEIKRESIWASAVYRRGTALIERRNNLVIRKGEGNAEDIIAADVPGWESMLMQIADPVAAPEVLLLRDTIRSWRFYDHFRTDADAPARQVQIGTRTPVLDHDGHDLAAALQTIIEDGDVEALDETIADAFPGAEVRVRNDNTRFSVEFYQDGLLRPLSQAELSDGTLRYLLWSAALLTSEPPSLMILNEPETSLHPDLLPALARLIIRASENTQMWIITHSALLLRELEKCEWISTVELEKELSETRVVDQGLVDTPSWNWPGR